VRRRAIFPRRGDDSQDSLVEERQSGPALPLLAVSATAWELSHRISHAEAEKLQALGVSPRLGIAVTSSSPCAPALSRRECMTEGGAERLDRSASEEVADAMQFLA
jgi:hypothetical protein